MRSYLFDAFYLLLMQDLVEQWTYRVHHYGDSTLCSSHGVFKLRREKLVP